jgi:hypothetical protein
MPKSHEYPFFGEEVIAMAKKVRIPFTQFHLERFLFMLGTMLFLFVAIPILDQFLGLKLLLNVFFSALMVSGIYAVSDRRHAVIIASIIAFAALMARWSNYVLASPSMGLVDDALGIVFSAYAGVVIISYVFREKEVTADVIYGAVCVYLFLGVTWAFLYALLEAVQPGSFDVENAKLNSFLYYSFVTQTTLGYGDITPATSPARSFSALQAIVGQLYIAVAIARLVGIHISQSLRKHSG